MIARLVATLAGLWLMAAPAVLDHVDTAAETSDRIAGPVAASLAFVAIWEVTRPLRWATLPVGLYCLSAPWLLGFPVDAAISSTVAGLVIAAMAVVRGTAGERYGGGWRSVVSSPDRHEASPPG